MEINKNNLTIEEVIAAQEAAVKRHFPINGGAYTLFLMGMCIEKAGETNEEDIDETFDKCTSYFNEFVHSEFNNTNKSLVECINEYMEWRLEQNKKEAYKNKLSSIDDRINMLQLEATCKNNEIKNKKKEIDAKYQAKYKDIKEFLIPIMDKVYKLRRFCSQDMGVTSPRFAIDFETCRIKFAESGTKEIGYYRFSNDRYDRYIWETWLSFESNVMQPDKEGFFLEFIKNWKEENKTIVTEALDAYVDEVSLAVNQTLAKRKINMMAEERALEGGEF